MSRLAEAPENRRALLVGVNHYYLDTGISNLQYCVNDVTAIDKILSDSLRGNFTTQMLHSGMGNKRFEPNRSNIMSMISLLSSNSQINDTILFYFAGHGHEESGVNYLLPGDSRSNVLVETAIPIRWIKEIFSKSLAKRKILIIDACHAGSSIGRAGPSPMSLSFKDELFRGSEGFAILSSCDLEEFSYDWPEMNHGVFSYFLLRGLEGSADYDKDGAITIPDLNRFVSSKIREWSLDRGVQQTPNFLYNVSGDILLVRVPYEDAVDLKSILYVQQTKESIDELSKMISSTFEELSFMSDEDIDENKHLLANLHNEIFSEQNIEKRAELGSRFIDETFMRRFSSSLVKYYAMDTVAKITEMKEVKKWLRDKPLIRRSIILEFVASGSFDYAGTMAFIIRNLVPIFTDEELKRIIEAIENNDQIRYSFKARGFVISIIDSCKTLIDIEKLEKLMKVLRG